MTRSESSKVILRGVRDHSVHAAQKALQTEAQEESCWESSGGDGTGHHG